MEKISPFPKTHTMGKIIALLLLSIITLPSNTSAEPAPQKQRHTLKYHWLRGHQENGGWRFRIRAYWETKDGEQGTASMELIGPSLRIPISLESFDVLGPTEGYVDFSLPEELAKQCSVRVKFVGYLQSHQWTNPEPITVPLTEIMKEAKPIQAHPTPPNKK